MLLPHFLECPWNNTYSWGRDGAQCYHSQPRDSEDQYYCKYYQRLLRK
jgi:hypothetical protein